MTKITRGYADTPHGQVHYRSVEGPGLPVLLFHRTPVSSICFEPMLRFLSGRRAAIAFDTPGFGQSFRPDGSPSTVDYARWFLAAADALGLDRFHLCAHHTGTHFAAEMARLAPERVQTLLLSGVVYASAEERRRRREGIGKAQGIDDDGRYLTDCWKLMKGLFLEYDARLVHAETMGALEAIEGRDQAFDALYDQDFAAVLREVRCPVRIVQAADDPLTLAGMLARLRTEHPDIPVETMGPAFLAAPERQPGQFARSLLSFIDDDQERTMTNRRYVLSLGEAGYDLQRADTSIPEPGPGEILVKVHAVSINRRDVSVRDLSYPVNGADNFTPCSDAAGEVLKVGEGVSQWQAGDRVCSTFFQNWEGGRATLPAVVSALGGGGPGVLADYVVLSQNGAVRIPDDWSYVEGASLACAGVTAWNGLMTLGQMQPDDWVLVIGTGGVALFAVQIAVAAGAKVVVLSSSDEKIARAKTLGAAAGINYRTTPEWADAVKKATGGGAHHALELGGAGTLQRTLSSMAIGGHVAMIGALDGFGGELSAVPLIMGALRLSSVLVGSRSAHRDLADFMVEHGIRPVIDSTYSFDAADEAYRRADAGAFGKVVITL